MVIKFDEILNNKTLKKPFVLMFLIKQLFEITKKYFQRWLQLKNVSITKHEIKQFRSSQYKCLYTPNSDFQEDFSLFTPIKSQQLNIKKQQLESAIQKRFIESRNSVSQSYRDKRTDLIQLKSLKILHISLQNRLSRRINKPQNMMKQKFKGLQVGKINQGYQLPLKNKIRRCSEIKVESIDENKKDIFDRNYGLLNLERNYMIRSNRSMNQMIELQTKKLKQKNKEIIKRIGQLQKPRENLILY